MQNKVFESFASAVADIQDGSTIMIAGFGPGTPHNLLKALYEQGAKDLYLIANGHGGYGSSGVITHGDIIAAGRVRRVTMAFTAATHPSRVTALEKLNEEGRVQAEITPQGSLAERIRAGGAGIPAFYTPAGVGTEVVAGKEHREFDGRTYVLEHALTADYAFVRAWKADEFGNLIFRRAQRNFNPIMATAARCTIVEAEEIVPIGELDPDSVHTPGVWVKRMVRIPPEPEGIWHVPTENIPPREAERRRREGQ